MISTSLDFPAHDQTAGQQQGHSDHDPEALLAARREKQRIGMAELQAVLAQLDQTREA